jgi:hypothetical protein
VRGDVNPEAAAWLLLSVLATRPLRASATASATTGATDGDGRRELDVGGLALRAIVAPG